MNRIKELREELNISQSELASKVEVTQSTICKYENGRQKISAAALIKLCDLFNCSASYLLGENDERKLPSKDDGQFPEITQKLLSSIPDLDMAEQQLMWNLIQTIKSKRGEDK